MVWIVKKIIQSEKSLIAVKQLVEENKQLEEGMKEILQAIKEMQKDPDVTGGEASLIIPSLERLVNVSRFFHANHLPSLQHFKDVYWSPWFLMRYLQLLEMLSCLQCVIFLWLFSILSLHVWSSPDFVCSCVSLSFSLFFFEICWMSKIFTFTICWEVKHSSE